MFIHITKGEVGKPPTLTCVREDGSRTWQHSSEYFARHDLIHYAVETRLALSEGFFGLVAAGRDLNDFGTRGGMKDHYPAELGRAESTAGMITNLLFGNTPMTDQEMADALQDAFPRLGIAPPPLTAGTVCEIRAHIRELHSRWDALPPGETLELTFPLPSTADAVRADRPA